MSWQVRKLGEFISIKHGWAFKGEYFSDTGKYILLTPGNAHETGGLKLRPGKEKFYLGDFPPDYLMKTGDMLIVMTDLIQAAPILGGAIVVPEDDRFLHNQRLGLVEFLPDTAMDKGFLYYLLNSPDYRAQVRGSATGATVRHTAPKRVCDCNVLVPDTVAEQRQVAHLLSAYDDLIATNQRRIALLEDAARRLYREWFVHLRFPGHESVPVRDGVPKGWRKGQLIDACQSIEDGDWIESKDQGGGDFRLLQVSNIGINQFIETANYRFVSEETFRRLRCREVLPGDFLISRMPDPIGRAWLVYEMPWRMITAVDVAIAKHAPDAVMPAFLLYHLNSEENLGLSGQQATGATRPRISRKQLATLPILLPSMALQIQFAAVVDSGIEAINSLRKQNERLAKARDLLLPKLMSGQLDVSGIPLPEEMAS
jgi:type I restriction enzyme S subunit